jgi:hypothetical protein
MRVKSKKSYHNFKSKTVFKATATKSVTDGTYRSAGNALYQAMNPLMINAL